MQQKGEGSLWGIAQPPVHVCQVGDVAGVHVIAVGGAQVGNEVARSAGALVLKVWGLGVVGQGGEHGVEVAHLPQEALDCGVGQHSRGGRGRGRGGGGGAPATQGQGGCCLGPPPRGALTAAEGALQEGAASPGPLRAIRVVGAASPGPCSSCSARGGKEGHDEVVGGQAVGLGGQWSSSSSSSRCCSASQRPCSRGRAGGHQGWARAQHQSVNGIQGQALHLWQASAGLTPLGWQLQGGSCSSCSCSARQAQLTGNEVQVHIPGQRGCLCAPAVREVQHGGHQAGRQGQAEAGAGAPTGCGSSSSSSGSGSSSLLWGLWPSLPPHVPEDGAHLRPPVPVPELPPHLLPLQRIPGHPGAGEQRQSEPDVGLPGPLRWAPGEGCAGRSSSSSSSRGGGKGRGRGQGGGAATALGVEGEEEGVVSCAAPVPCRQNVAAVGQHPQGAAVCEVVQHSPGGREEPAGEQLGRGGEEAGNKAQQVGGGYYAAAAAAAAAALPAAAAHLKQEREGGQRGGSTSWPSTAPHCSSCCCWLTGWWQGIAGHGQQRRGSHSPQRGGGPGWLLLLPLAILPHAPPSCSCCSSAIAHLQRHAVGQAPAVHVAAQHWVRQQGAQGWAGSSSSAAAQEQVSQGRVVHGQAGAPPEVLRCQVLCQGRLCCRCSSSSGSSCSCSCSCCTLPTSSQRWRSCSGVALAGCLPSCRPALQQGLERLRQLPQQGVQHLPLRMHISTATTALPQPALMGLHQRPTDAHRQGPLHCALIHLRPQHARAGSEQGEVGLGGGALPHGIGQHATAQGSAQQHQGGQAQAGRGVRGLGLRQHALPVADGGRGERQVQEAGHLVWREPAAQGAQGLRQGAQHAHLQQQQPVGAAGGGGREPASCCSSSSSSWLLPPPPTHWLQVQHIQASAQHCHHALPCSSIHSPLLLLTASLPQRQRCTGPPHAQQRAPHPPH